MNKSPSQARITTQTDGPFKVEGEIPLVKKSQIVSEYGEPLNWRKDGDIECEGQVLLCRCGFSKNKPFCDSTHLATDFDGTDQVDNRPSVERRADYPEGVGIVVRKDEYLCTESGFCSNRRTDIYGMMLHTDEPGVRAEIMAMIDRCPSGSFTYALDEHGTDIEADLPVEIAVTTEILSDGPVEGPLWVTGNIPVICENGTLLETRNRVALCRCGRSEHKPLCDGTHRLKD